jgi:fucose permease
MSSKRSTALPIFLAFLAMGFGDAASSFVSLAKEQFQLSNILAQLIPFVAFLMFGLLSVPMGVFQDKKGKKFVLILGLSIMLAGVLIPTIMGLSTFPVFLIWVLLLGAGATTLQVAGNPIMRDVSAEGMYSRNLSMGQFVKAIGTLSGPMIPVIAMRAFGASWSVIFPIYSAAVFITILAVVPLKVEERREATQQRATFSSSLALVANPYVAMMVFALFLYVGAEQSVASNIPIYLKDRFQIDVNRTGLLGTGLFFLALTIGRFSGGVILNWMKPARFYVVTTAVSLLGLVGMFVPSQMVAVVSFFLIGLGFANIFPLVFSMVIDSMPEHANALSGLMVMAIVGGAVLPPLMGLVADMLHSTQLAFSVPLGAVVYIAITAVLNSRRAAAAAKA